MILIIVVIYHFIVEDLTDSRRVALSAHPDCVSALRLAAGAAMEAPWEAVGSRWKGISP